MAFTALVIVRKRKPCVVKLMLLHLEAILVIHFVLVLLLLIIVEDRLTEATLG